MTDDGYRVFRTRRYIWPFLENFCLVAVVVVSILIWLYVLVVVPCSIATSSNIPSMCIDEVSEWQGPFDGSGLSPHIIRLYGATQYEKRTGKATILCCHVDFTEARAIPDKNYVGEYPPRRWYIYGESKTTIRRSSVIIAIVLNLTIVIGLLWSSRRIHNRLARESL